MPRERIPQSDVLAWLKEHHPQLHQDAYIDRDWVWLTTNLSGKENEAVRESLKQNGFRFAHRPHVLSNGKEARWAHSSMKPLPFNRKHTKSQPKGSAPIVPELEMDKELQEAMEAFSD